MKRGERLRAWLKEPHGKWLAAVYVPAAAVIAGAIVMTFYAERSPALAVLAYVLYGAAALLLALCVYTTVRLAPGIRRGVLSLLRRNRLTARLIGQYDFRTIVFATGSFLISTAYAVFNFVLSILSRAAWYAALAGYYLLLAVMRGIVVRFHGKRRKARIRREQAGEEEPEPLVREREQRARRTRIAIYGSCGAMLVILPACLSAATVEMILGTHSFVYAGIAIYVAAAYAFYKISMSIYNMFKARRSDDMTVRAVRSINLADAMVSIFALQTAMFHEFSPGADTRVATAALGGIVCALTVLLGLFMIAGACRKWRELRRAEREGAALPEEEPTKEDGGE